MRLKEIEKIANARTEARYICKCGHSLNLGNMDKVICHWCGNYVFKDKKTEFKYRMRELKNTLKN